ncbi:hypothetical protein EMEDMD4_730035 [Sinorhizobium medicae]|uniref:Uncharacterized protein n=1 Tax=Sinorhizobium medicae TaxID=110321 RepID=A0A508X5I9_9HYPH|nr:hypothetical protein EMEDMD4_730035 [Sinorhizobium medicae]
MTIAKRSRTNIFCNVIRTIPIPEDYHWSRSCQLSARINTRFASIVWHAYSGIHDLQSGSSSKAYNDGKVNWENSGKIVNCCCWWWQQQCAVVDWWFSRQS